MKKILIPIICAVVFLSAAVAFLWVMITENDAVLVVPAVVCFLGSCALLFLLFKEIFIGHNTYSIEN